MVNNEEPDQSLGSGKLTVLLCQDRLRTFFYALLFLTVLIGKGRSASAADSEETPRADTVYLNGTVLTMNATNNIAQAVAIEGDGIKAVGSNSDIRTLVSPKTRVVDLAGKPYFLDSSTRMATSPSQVFRRCIAWTATAHPSARRGASLTSFDG